MITKFKLNGGTIIVILIAYHIVALRYIERIATIITENQQNKPNDEFARVGDDTPLTTTTGITENQQNEPNDQLAPVGDDTHLTTTGITENQQNEPNDQVAPVGDDTPLTTTGPTTGTTEKKMCVLFAGPMKTGSTALQHYFRSKRGLAALLEDNYADYGSNSYKVASCFNKRSTRSESICAEHINNFGSFVSANAGKRNIMAPHERFARRGMDVDKFANYLNPNYNIHAVLYYRRFYDWIFSMYNQIQKPRFKQKDIKPDTQPFHQWLRKNIDKQYNDQYIIPAYNRYNNSPGIYNLTVVNMHKDAANFDSVEAFVCDLLDDAPHTCEAARSRPPDEHNNHSKNLDWILVRNKLSVYHPIDHFNDETWVKVKEKFDGMVDRPHICVDDDLKDKLLQISLDSEMEMTPESFYNSDEGLKALRSDFEKKIMTKMCDVDVEAIVTSPEWQEFLKGLETTMK